MGEGQPPPSADGTPFVREEGMGKDNPRRLRTAPPSCAKRAWGRTGAKVAWGRTCAKVAWASGGKILQN